VFGPGTNTQQIYHRVGRKIVKAAMSGYNGTVLVYGQTTSGKTYTMLGTPEKPGILPCALRDIFKGIQADTQRQYKVWISYLEIYNEIINDLLIPGSVNLRIKEDSAVLASPHFCSMRWWFRG
jgi:centromeric protein E